MTYGQNPQQPSGYPQQEPEPQPSETAVTYSCPEGIDFPADGVDQEACGPIPPDAVPFSQIAGENYPVLLTEDENITCEMDGKNLEAYVDHAFVYCDAEETNYEPLIDEYGAKTTAFMLEEKAEVASPADSGESEFFTIKASQAVYVDDIVCRAAPDGMVCWNSVTHHGFQLSRDQMRGW